MKNKNLIYILIALAILVTVAGTFLGLWYATRPQTAQGEKTVTIIVVHSDGTTKNFLCHTDEEYLAAVLEAENIAQGDTTQYGLTIHTVDGEKASWEENQSYWALYIGEDYATTGASETPVYDGSVFKLVYTLG